MALPAEGSDDRDPAPTEVARVHPMVALWAAYSWRILAIAAVVVGAFWLLGQLKVVVVPLAIALLASRVLEPMCAWLRRHRWPPGLAALAVVLGALVVVAGLGTLIVRPMVDEFDELGTTVEQSIEDLETWIVDEGPFEVTREELAEMREGAVDRVVELVSSSDGAIAGNVSLLVEIPTGLILSLFLTFFYLKDGHRFVAWARDRFPARKRPAAVRAGRASWGALGGFLRGAAILGLVEAIVIGGTVWIVGGSLVLPIMVITFAAAFVPIIGAIVAGVIAVLVVLVTVGVGPAVAVGIVAILVQQLDNDLLAPVIYGRSLELHPVLILVTIVGGAALFGFVGAILAVPVVAVTINAALAAREPPVEEGSGGT